jgi:PAS domain S-box-containing protein
VTIPLMAPRNRRPALTLRRMLLVLVTAGVAYVGVIALVISLRVTPVASDLQAHSQNMLGAHDAIRRRLDLLDESIGQVHAFAIESRNRRGPASEAEFNSLSSIIRGRLDIAAATSYAGELPATIRNDLANAAHSQRQIGAELLAALDQVRLGNSTDALGRLRQADDERRATEQQLHLAERGALADMVRREGELAAAARNSGHAVLWWLVIGAALLPFLIMFMRDRVYQPLRELEAALTRIARGDLNVHIASRRDDELGRLGRHLNEMIAVLRLRADDERRRRENLSERLGHLLEESDNQIFVLAGDTLRVVQASRGATLHLGYQLSDLQDRTGLDLFPGADAAAFARAIQALRERGEGQLELETRLLRRDGRSYPATMSVQLSFAEQPPVFVVVAQDITERREAERLREALKDFSLSRGSLIAIGDAERSLQEIAAATAKVLGAERASIWRVDGSLLRCYDHFERTASSHATRPDVPADSCPQFLKALGTERVIAISDVRANPRPELACSGLEGFGVSSTLDAPVRTGNLLKGTLHIERLGQPRPWTAEEQSFAASMADFVAIAFEGAERRSLQVQLAESQRMESVGQLAGGVAHDFNNLLTAILSHVELAGLLLEEDHPAVEDLKGIADASARAADLTRQLLTFARRQAVDPKLVDLNDLTRRMNKLLRRLIGEDVELVTLLDPDIGAARVDPTQFEQVIVNLAVNARDAMNGGGKLTIETSNVELGVEYVRQHSDVTPGSYVMVAVSDTGMGMDEAVRARVFEPFFTTKDRSRGTGLGLATVYGIVRQAGGHIVALSQVGQGTTFKVFLPMAAPVAPSATLERDVVAAGGSETILLVEDEPQIRAVLVRGLEAQGYNILVAGNGAEALELSRRTEEPIHLVLTDVVMPLMNGPDLARALAGERPDTNVMFMSGYTDQAMGESGAIEPGITFIAKPFTVAELALKVRETLDETCVLVAAARSSSAPVLAR